MLILTLIIPPWQEIGTFISRWRFIVSDNKMDQQHAILCYLSTLSATKHTKAALMINQAWALKHFLQHWTNIFIWTDMATDTSNDQWSSNSGIYSTVIFASFHKEATRPAGLPWWSSPSQYFCLQDIFKIYIIFLPARYQIYSIEEDDKRVQRQFCWEYGECGWDKQKGGRVIEQKKYWNKNVDQMRTRRIVDND